MMVVDYLAIYFRDIDYILTSSGFSQHPRIHILNQRGVPQVCGKPSHAWIGMETPLQNTAIVLDRGSIHFLNL